MSDDQAEVTVTVKSVKEKELPTVDDEFASLASEFDTVAELRADLRTRLERAKAFAQGSQARDRLLEQLLDTVDFPLPDSAIQAEVDYREHEIVHALEHDDALPSTSSSSGKGRRARSSRTSCGNPPGSQ